MKYVQINSNSYSWAKNIVFKFHKQLLSEGVDSYVIWGNGSPTRNDHEIKINTKWNLKLDGALTRIDGKMGFHSHIITKRLLKELDRIQPDIVHLYSPLGYYLNIEMFFKWLAKNNCKFIWTLHDCWAFTGYCLHFTMANCNQWKESCTNNCPAPTRGGRYPDFGVKRRIAWSFEKKKQLFTMLPEDRVTLITPSEWLAGLVKQSFLGKYTVEVIHNTIDKDVFKPVLSDYKKKFNLENKFVILGVSLRWDDRKGLPDFIKLLTDLDEDYAVILVGLRPKQISEINEIAKGSKSKFIGMTRTESQEELVRIYSISDVFFNPTLEENYPTVNLEAQACGTPVITYDTGGCRETIVLKDSCVVADYINALNQIKRLKLMKEKDMRTM